MFINVYHWDHDHCCFQLSFVAGCETSILNGILIFICGRCSAMRYFVFMRSFVGRGRQKLESVLAFENDTSRYAEFTALAERDGDFPWFSYIWWWSHADFPCFFPRIVPSCSMLEQIEADSARSPHGSPKLSGADWPSCATHTFWRRTRRRFHVVIDDD